VQSDHGSMWRYPSAGTTVVGCTPLYYRPSGSLDSFCDEFSVAFPLHIHEQFASSRPLRPPKASKPPAEAERPTRPTEFFCCGILVTRQPIKLEGVICPRLPSAN